MSRKGRGSPQQQTVSQISIEKYHLVCNQRSANED